MLVVMLMIALGQDVTTAPLAAARPAGEREAVLAVVQSFFDTMAARDQAAARRVLLPEGRFVSVGQAEGGGPVSRTLTVERYLASLSTQKQKFRERMWNPEVRVHGAIAVVWTPYDFWVDGQFSHCGVDAFDLVKTEEGWKLAGGIYTVERTGCAPSPLGPLEEGNR